jgi:hypothetical protein
MNEKVEVWSSKTYGVKLSVCYNTLDHKYYTDIYYDYNIMSIGPYNTLEEAKYAGEQERDSVGI